MSATIIEPTPSAGLEGGPATPPTTPIAPSANGANRISSLTEAAMAQLAGLSLRELADAAEPSTPTPPVAIESPAAPAESPAIVAGQTPTPPEAVSQPDDAEPSAEVLASLNESGRRALQSEREKRKEARTKLAEALAEIERLKSVQPPVPVEPAALNAVPAATQAPIPSPAPSALPTELAACQTFEAVDACAMQAARQEAMAMQLNTVLVTAGVQAVVDRLKANGVETFRGVPVDQLTGEQLAGQLSSTYEQARLTQLAAGQQKQNLADQNRSFSDALQMVPELRDPKSARGQQFAAILNANPRIRELGSNWPVLLAQQILGMEAVRTRTATTPTPPHPQPVPAAILPSAPSAPRTSVAAVAQPTELDAIRARVTNGRASEADMTRYASLQVRAN